MPKRSQRSSTTRKKPRAGKRPAAPARRFPYDLHGMGVLVSYYNWRDTDVEEVLTRWFGNGPRPPIFCDSGAYSAYTLGKPLDVDRYAAWLHRWRTCFTVYASLDVLGSPTATMANYHRLRDHHGLDPMPVFHPADPWDQLDVYLAESDYIALGGIASKDVRKGDEIAYAARAMKRARSLHPDRDIRFHGFGRTDWKTMRAVPWHTVDSTTWMMGHRYGSLVLFANGRLFQARKAGFRKHEAALRSLGFTIGDADRAVSGDVATSTRIGLASMAKAQAWIRRMHRDDFTIYLAGRWDLLPSNPPPRTRVG